MAQIANPRKVFRFIVEVEGLNQFEVQKIKLPEAEIDATAHGDTNHDVKTPGRIKFSDMTMSKLRPAPGGDRWAWNWLIAAQNATTGAGGNPLNISRVIVVREMDETGTVALNSWVCTGCWVKKVSMSEFDRTSSDNSLEEVTFSVDKMELI